MSLLCAITLGYVPVGKRFSYLAPGAAVPLLYHAEALAKWIRTSGDFYCPRRTRLSRCDIVRLNALLGVQDLVQMYDEMNVTIVVTCAVSGRELERVTPAAFVNYFNERPFGTFDAMGADLDGDMLSVIQRLLIDGALPAVFNINVPLGALTHHDVVGDTLTPHAQQLLALMDAISSNDVGASVTLEDYPLVVEELVKPQNFRFSAAILCALTNLYEVHMVSANGTITHLDHRTMLCTINDVVDALADDEMYDELFVNGLFVE